MVNPTPFQIALAHWCKSYMVDNFASWFAWNVSNLKLIESDPHCASLVKEARETVEKAQGVIDELVIMPVSQLLAMNLTTEMGYRCGTTGNIAEVIDNSMSQMLDVDTGHFEDGYIGHRMSTHIPLADYVLAVLDFSCEGVRDAEAIVTLAVLPGQLAQYYLDQFKRLRVEHPAAAVDFINTVGEIYQLKGKYDSYHEFVEYQNTSLEELMALKPVKAKVKEYVGFE